MDNGGFPLVDPGGPGNESPGKPKNAGPKKIDQIFTKHKGVSKMKCLQCEEVVTNADYELANSAEIVGYACSSECVEELWHSWSVNQ